MGDWVNHNWAGVATEQGRVAARQGRDGLPALQVPHQLTKGKLPLKSWGLDQEAQRSIQHLDTLIQHLTKLMTAATKTIDSSNINTNGDIMWPTGLLDCPLTMGASGLSPPGISALQAFPSQLRPSWALPGHFLSP